MDATKEDDLKISLKKAKSNVENSAQEIVPTENKVDAPMDKNLLGPWLP